jgi:UPF0755 protein
VFGALPSRFDPDGPKKPVASFLDPNASHGVDGITPTSDAPTPIELAMASGKRLSIKTRSRAASNSFVLGPGIDALGITIQGAPPVGAAALDGPIDSVSDDPAPAPPADLAAAAALPTTGTASEGGASGQGPAGMQMAAHVPPEHPKIIDVSEGTNLDPLREKNYDLNSAKTVPDFGKLPQ